jgi:hypothetical protein
MALLKKWALSLLLSAAAVVFALISCELLLQLSGSFPDQRSPRSAMLESAQLAAHSFANTNGHYEPGSIASIYAEGRTVSGEIDNVGYLGNRDPEAKPTEILVFGDSFAYGFGVAERDAFAAKLGGYNGGLWGEAFPMHLKVFRRIVPVLGPKLAIWAVYPPHVISCTGAGWYTRRNISKKAHPFLFALVQYYNRLTLSSLVLKVTGWGLNRPDYYSLEWDLYDPKFSGYDEGYRQFEQAVKGITSVASNAGIQLFVLFVPSKNRIALELEGDRPRLYPAAQLDPNVPIVRMARILEAHVV